MKNGTIAFKKHERSACHQESVEIMIVLPQTTKNIGELMAQQHAIQNRKNRDVLLCIIRSIKFLFRQGLALRGGGDGLDGNLHQLLLMREEQDPNLAEWLQRKDNVFTSPDIQNELIKTLGITILRDLASDLQSSPFICIMVDETSDISENSPLLLFAGLCKTSRCMRSSLVFIMFLQ